MSTEDARPRLDAEAVKREWLHRLDGLVDEIKSWAEKSGWRTRRIEKTLTERALGSYKVPVLFMEKETVEAVLNPVARFVPDAEGSVDLYLALAYDDVAVLTLMGERWFVRSPDDPDPRPCSEPTIRAILDGMAAPD